MVRSPLLQEGMDREVQGYLLRLTRALVGSHWTNVCSLELKEGHACFGVSAALIHWIGSLDEGLPTRRKIGVNSLEFKIHILLDGEG